MSLANRAIFFSYSGYVSSIIIRERIEILKRTLEGMPEGILKGTLRTEIIIERLSIGPHSPNSQIAQPH